MKGEKQGSIKGENAKKSIEYSVLKNEIIGENVGIWALFRDVADC